MKLPPVVQPLLCDTATTCFLLGNVDRDFVDWRAKTGRLDYQRKGRNRLYRYRDVEAFAERFEEFYSEYAASEALKQKRAA